MKGFFDDDDDDDVAPAPPPRAAPAFFHDPDGEGNGRTSPQPPGGATAAAAGGDDDVDPLDAFMATNAEEAERVGRKRPERGDGMDDDGDDWDGGGGGGADDDEEPDNVESFLAFKAEQQSKLKGDEPEYDEEGNLIDAEKEILQLPPVDHSAIAYPPFKKNTFVPAADTLVDADKANAYRKLRDIRVKGEGAIPPPSPTLDGLGLGYTLTALLKSKFDAPTPIQSQTVTTALSGRDIIGIAKTGSGKTGAFLWPVISHITHLPPPAERGSPQALVVAPTRELAKQIFDVCKQWCKPFNFNVVSLFGGSGSMGQVTALKQPCEIVVGTPARLIHFIRLKHLRVFEVRFLCMDEADKMLDMGFEAQIRTLCSQLRPDRLTLMFSATFKSNVQQLAKDLLLDPLRINVGAIGAVNTDITQLPVVLHDNSQKLVWLEAKLAQLVAEGSVLIFVSQKHTADELAETLTARGFNVASTHGEKAQAVRSKIHFAFKSGNLPVLVATDVASRGLDIGDVKTVIQYEPPKNIDTHTHRVGRTGRAGSKGTAYALIGPSDGKFASIVSTTMQQAGQLVPPQVQELANRQRAQGGGRGRGLGATGRKKHKGGGGGAPAFVAARNAPNEDDDF